MNKQSLLSYLALHRRGYFLAGIWAALWVGLLIAFFWHFRFASGIAHDDSEFDAVMQMAIYDGIQVSRYAAMYFLVPVSALLAALILIIADTFLYLFHLDRSKIWFEAVKWTLSGWKAFLVWLAVNFLIYLLPLVFAQNYVVWISISLGVALLLALPFVILNKDYVVAGVPRNFTKIQWPGARPTLLAATFIAIAMPLSVFCDKYFEAQLNPWLIFFIDILRDFIFAIAMLFLSDAWINRRKKIDTSNIANWRNIGGFFSLNMMSGMWATALFAPPLTCAVLISFFLMPSIIQSGQLSFDSYQMFSRFDQAIQLVTVYWWLFMIPGVYWLSLHAYGRLIFLLGLTREETAIRMPGSRLK